MTEREQIADWLALRVVDELGPIIDWPDWRIWLWAIFHPVASAVVAARGKALMEAANAIERGEHAA